MVVLHETGLVNEVELIPAAVSPVTTGDPALERNPLGKIPTLVTDDGVALYDSRVITRYLDDRAGSGLYGAAGAWDVLTLEATGDGICDAGVAIVYEARFREEEMRNQAWLDGQWGKVERTLDALGTRWADHLEGPLDIGQIAVGCALGYLDFRLPERDWRQGRDGLAAWYARIAERPAFAATTPQG
jgi:glutathione S-transferase